MHVDPCLNVYVVPLNLLIQQTLFVLFFLFHIDVSFYIEAERIQYYLYIS